MEKKCDNCVNDNIGCDVIKQLRKDVLKIKVNRSCLHIIALLVCSLGFIIAGLFAYRTFFSVPTTKDIVYDIKISGEKNISTEVKAEIKKELAEALIEVENRAVAAYNEKFTALLTILTIFGIAWPVIITMLQAMSLAQDRRKIEDVIESNKSLLDKNRTLQADLEQLYIDFFFQIANVNLELSILQGFDLDKKLVLNNVRTPVILDVDSNKKRHFVLIFLLDSIIYYIYAERKKASSVDEKNSSIEQIRLCAFYIENLVFNTKIPKSDIPKECVNIDNVICRLEMLESKHLYCKQAIAHLNNAKNILNNDHGADR